MSTRLCRLNISKRGLRFSPLQCHEQQTFWHSLKTENITLPMFPQFNNWHLQPLNTQSQIPVNISDSSLSRIIHIQSICNLTLFCTISWLSFCLPLWLCILWLLLILYVFLMPLPHLPWVVPHVNKFLFALKTCTTVSWAQNDCHIII